MAYQPHYIASYDQDSGYFTYTEPFVAPEKAFPVLEDAYCWRARVQRRKGNSLLGRLRHKITTVSLAGGISSATTTVNLFTGLSIAEANAQIQPGTVAFPVTINIAAPISETLIDNTGTGIMVPAPGVAITAATINYETWTLTLTFSGVYAVSAVTVSLWYYPGLPVMGCSTQELTTVDDISTVFFDTTYAYKFNPSTNLFDDLPSVAPTVWHGFDYNLFWTTTYSRNTAGDLLWATNNNMQGATQDPMRYYDTTTWTDFTPLITATDTLYNSLIVLAYKDRLIMMNTWEGTTAGTIAAAANFPTRIRWSWNGDPLNVDAFRSDKVGFGGYLDAPTSEQIVSAEFIKDTLLIKFERSSWKLVYTGNEVLPFVFQKINTEMGSESTFSVVPFDRGVYTVSNVGITTDDSVNVERMDLQIPQTVYDFSIDDHGLQRIYGIRDYVNELVYWTYRGEIEPANPLSESYFPDQVLVYNYRNNTYAIFNDSFTSYGYFQAREPTWAQLTYPDWSSWTTPWNEGVPQAVIPNVVGGNQQGFVHKIAQQVINDPSLMITNIDPTTSIVTSPTHNLFNADIVQLSGIIGPMSTLNGTSYMASVIDMDTFQLLSYNGINWIPADLSALVGSEYLGGGLIARWNSFHIATKVFVPYYEQGSQCRLGYVDFLFDKTESGHVTSNVYVDENDTFSMTDSFANPALVGGNAVNTCPDNTTLIPFQAQQKKIWHRQFVQTVAQNIQIELTMEPLQTIQFSNSSSDFVLHAVAMYLSPNARLTQ